MIGPGTGVRVYLACGATDMRKGIAGLAALAQDVLRQKPTGGAVFAFRGHKGDRLKLLYWDGQPPLSGKLSPRLILEVYAEAGGTGRRIGLLR